MAIRNEPCSHERIPGYGPVWNVGVSREIARITNTYGTGAKKRLGERRIIHYLSKGINLQRG